MKSPGRARGNDESEWDSKLDGDRIIHSWTVFFSFFFLLFKFLVVYMDGLVWFGLLPSIQKFENSCFQLLLCL